MNLMLLGFELDVSHAFSQLGHKPKVLLQSGVKSPADVDRDPDVEVYHYSSYADCQIPAIFCKEVDRDVAKRVRERAYVMFVRCFDRLVVRGRQPKQSWLFLNNYFEICLNFNWDILIKKKIDHVIFSNIPHGSNDLVLYYLCKELEIPTTVICQSQVPNHFFVMSAIEDFGFFESSFPFPSGPPAEVKKRPNTPFYMRARKPPTAFGKAGAIAYAAATTALRWGPAQFGIGTKHYVKSLFNFQDARDQYRVHVSVPHAVFDPRAKYVYFPLHLQPEMTTDILGGDYADQLLAIEELARVLPDDVLIYVKENPAQTGVMREHNFYSRLFSIDRVRYLPITVDTLELVDKSLFVATITGTAGFEAIQMGKPCLIFGEIWYRRLPGVFEWRNLSDVSSVMTSKPDESAVVAGLEQIYRYLRPGVVDLGYSRLVGDFDRTANASTVARSLIDFVTARNVRNRLQADTDN